MHESAGWQFDVDVHPPDWNFPAGQSWFAGWIRPPGGEAVTDVRAWVDQQPFLGLHGLPRPHLKTDSPVLPQASGPGFSFLVTPPRNARLLRLEVSDLAGHWAEFFRTPIRVAPEAVDPPPPASLAKMLPTLVPTILRGANRQPERAWSTLADTAVAAARAETLNALPNPPFVGALEAPSGTGLVEYGRLTVTGWLAHRGAKISRVTAIVDSQHEIPLSRGVPRPEIAEKFPDLAHHENCVFVGQVDLPAGLPAPVLLKVFAELDNGERHLAFAQRFTPRTSVDTVQPLPAASAFQFVRAVWSLRGAAGRQGVPTTGFIRAARTAWAAYPFKPATPPAGLRPATGENPPLRILVVTHNLNFEGAPRLILEFAAFLNRQPGVSVRVISSREGPLRPLFEAAGMSVTVLDLAPVLGATSPTAFHANLGALDSSFDWSTVDLVIANTMLSFWAVHWARHAGKPAVLYVHESAAVAPFFTPLVDPALFPLVEEAFALARRVVFTAYTSRQIFASLERGHNFRVLPSWLGIAGIEDFLARHNRATLRARHGFAADSILLLNLGTVCERKGQQVFVRTAELIESELRARHPGRKIEFVMVGAREDAFLDSLRSMVTAARLQQVHFVPETRENYDFLGMADILVCTSFQESSPRVLLEAAAFGLPIVSTDVDGIPEMLTGRDAWLVQPGDPYLLAAALRQALAAHFAGNTARAARTRTKVVARYDERVSLPRHLALAREAAASIPV